MNVSDKLKLFRKSKGWSKRRLSRYLGVSVTSIIRWENGEPVSGYNLSVIDRAISPE